MIKACLVCQKDFQSETRSRTCSKECRLKHNNNRRTKNTKKLEKISICKWCKKEFKRYDIKNGFCSRTCAGKKYYEDGTYDSWKKFVSPKRTPEEEIQHRLRKRVSWHVRNYLKKQLIPKESATWQKLDYSPEELKEHLESLFDENMSWENYGTYWHIDHIIPQSKLLYKTLDDDNFKTCWSLENLRPLEAIENIKKSNKIIGEIHEKD